MISRYVIPLVPLNQATTNSARCFNASAWKVILTADQTLHSMLPAAGPSPLPMQQCLSVRQGGGRGTEAGQRKKNKIFLHTAVNGRGFIQTPQSCNIMPRMPLLWVRLWMTLSDTGDLTWFTLRTLYRYGSSKFSAVHLLIGCF